MLVYRGPSLIDGAPILAVATLGSANRKTGPMVQTWILRADQDPLTASRSGADASVCGDCPHRWATGGGCYVNLGQAPLSVWRAAARGVYDADDRAEAVVAALQAGTPLRIGSYGDPMAVPAAQWRDLLDIVRAGNPRARWTGYTHRWADDRADAAEYRAFLMASVDSHREALRARAAGWRYFRVRADESEPPLGAEVECLADARGMTCEACGICNGARDRAVQPASVYIAAHGVMVGRVKRVAALRVVS